MPDADDELAGGAVVLHVVVGLWHLLQAVVDAVHGEGQPAGRVVDSTVAPRHVASAADLGRRERSSSHSRGPLKSQSG